MSRVDAAAADRLPWLPDEPSQKPQKRTRGALLPWAAVPVLLVAAGGFWFGVRNLNTQAPIPARHAPASTTVRLPAPRAAEQPQVQIPVQPQVRAESAPEVRPAPVRQVRIVPPRPAKSGSAAPAGLTAPGQEKADISAVTVPASPPAFVMPKPWNPRVFQGAAGRVVQIGAFGSIHQSKRGWWFMVRSYPAVSDLPAVVRPARNSKGRIFYRFQVGTTSQAHSEVLCQRMQRIKLSCAVVGLPWRAKVER